MALLYRVILIISLIASFQHLALAEDDSGIFSGRVSKINTKASIVRVKVKFLNMKYLNKKDRVEFWNEHNPEIRCRGFVIGKSPDYMLLRVSELGHCLKSLYIADGGYLKFYSQDLENNLKMGNEIMSILLKKRLAVQGKLNKSKRLLENHFEKVDAINLRYKLLREKLELEWQSELALLEDDRIVNLRNYKALQLRLGEIEHKVEQYKVEDNNLLIDRWALDSKLYYKK